MAITDDTFLTSQSGNPPARDQSGTPPVGDFDLQLSSTPTSSSSPDDFNLNFEDTSSSPTPDTTNEIDLEMHTTKEHDTTASTDNFSLDFSDLSSPPTSPEFSSNQQSEQEGSISWTESIQQEHWTPWEGDNPSDNEIKSFESETEEDPFSIPAPSEQSTDSEQLTNDEPLATNEQVAPDEQVATNEQIATDEQVATNEQIATDEQVTPDEQVATNEQIATDEQVATNEQIATDEQVATNEQIATDELSLSEPTIQPLNASQPNTSYQPTPDAFDQTISALATAKEEGNNVISSDTLAATTPEQPMTSSSEEKVLNLDQMVAKFNGDELPIAQNPFEPMKKALEEEEKKDLLEKGVSITDNIPLVVEPEKTDVPTHEEENISFTPPSQAITESTIEIPAFALQTNETTPTEPLLSENAPQTQTSEPTTLSLDDIADTTVPSVPVTTSLQTATTTTMFPQLIEKLKNPRILAGIGGGVVLIFVLIMMFPAALSPSSSPSSFPPEQSTIVPHEPIEELPTLPEEPSHSAPETPSLPTEPSQPPLEPSSNEENVQPFLPDEPTEPLIVDPTPPQISPQEMITELTNLSNQSKQYLDIGEMDDDNIIVKYAGYVRYQAGFMINQLESWTPFSIEYYTTMTNRMNTLLTHIHTYNNGGDFPNLLSTLPAIDDELQKQELQNFIYEKNGDSPT